MSPDTLFALASGYGAVAVLRISGPDTSGVVARLAGSVPPPRRAVVRILRDDAGRMLDQALVLWMPGPGSYTGEDSAELQVHGGVAVVEGVAAALVAAGARPAEAGEFTERAFLNGRMDLLEAEGVADLIAAETGAQRDLALRQMGGALSGVYEGWSARLLGLLARQEALIDFPDEDLPPEVEAGVLLEMAALVGEMGAHLDEGAAGERLREGLVFAVAGAPNVGKSTLVNALAGREVAIVSAQAGTTRDVLEARVVLGGVPVTLLDTAGLREAGDAIEAEGVRRARARAGAADLVIAVSEVGGEVEPGLLGGEVLRVFSKADVVEGAAPDGLAVSARTGAGMEALRAALADVARRLTASAGAPVLTRARHRAAVSAAKAALEAALEARMPELRGEELRVSVRELGRLTGSVGVEDVFDAVFRQFCIGK